MEKPDSPLFTLLAEPQARRVTAQAHGLPSGAIPALLAVHLAPNGHPRHVYSAKIATDTLVRSYLARLVRAKYVERSTNGRTRSLRITLEGLSVISYYERQLRAGRKSFQNA